MLVVVAAGFSVVVGMVLLAAYLRSNAFPQKSWFSVVSGIALTLSLTVLQWCHLQYFLGDVAPLQRALYVVALFSAPASFFYFGRIVLFPEAPLRSWLFLPLLLLVLPVLLPLEIALPFLLLVGAGFSGWLSYLAFGIRERRRQRDFEFLFSIVCTGSACIVLLLGAALPWLDEQLFYSGYTIAIAVAYGLACFALVAIPDFINDLFDVTRARYAVSTLAGHDIRGLTSRLDVLMRDERVYQEDALSLGTLAELLAISPHQLSELLNGHVGSSFNHYVRRYRIEAAQEMLLADRKRSILSISLEVGFASQSSFYAAFKEVVGVAPGEYRKSG